MARTAGVISLGCSKNRVDTEYLLGYLKNAGFSITPAASQAEVIIINTCGFITLAKEESINTILEMAQYKKAGACRLLAVTGCLSQRYPAELKAELPEADILWGVKDQRGLVEKICAMLGDESFHCGADAHRILTTPAYSAYLRIADGCDNCCSYCAIPLIRGARASVPMDRLIREACDLADRGVKELTVIAQDTSAYGVDLYGKPMLAELLTELVKIGGLHWIRVLYAYPNTVDKNLIDTIVAQPKLVNYIDLPIQHIAPEMLKAMNRHGSSEHIREILRYMRGAADDFILRTTVITGFPGETEAQFGQLTEFMQEQPFDRLGAFAYSQEEGTSAAERPDQIDEDVKLRRLDEVMRLQQRISRERNQRRVGSITECLVERVEEGIAYGRSYAEAPEVDGCIKVRYHSPSIRPGEFINIKITSADDYDLRGEEI